MHRRFYARRLRRLKLLHVHYYAHHYESLFYEMMLSSLREWIIGVFLAVV